MTLIEEVRIARDLPKPEVARLIRESAGVSQIRLANELGVARNTISRWETGDRRPRGELRLRYAQLLSELRAVA
ncbi:helix-turn-helix transcriptional regulator [Agromyces albus]|uniref:helix-turn-helix transcriptional regulator n=1 Tax=Agromyces albus TaxID=205332 RepID=UPI00278965EB|nr:helix-turn-helix transcriptional regulator [Agromyces albus]MDQ0576467.1 transcriptional regulator with XRE-family HTH domain [Agromyces albus]